MFDHEVLTAISARLTRIERMLETMLGPALTAAVAANTQATTALQTAEAALPQNVTDDADVQNAITAIGANTAAVQAVTAQLQAMAPAPAASSSSSASTASSAPAISGS